MLKLNVYGPYFGLPDGSPFCIKAMTLLKMSGLDHSVSKMSFKQAPKGKAPYLDDDGTIVADSHFIQRHLEAHYGINFSQGYGPTQLATGWALSRMVEEHLYFLNIQFRWLDDENFKNGPSQFFAEVPSLIRPVISTIVRKKQRKTLYLQGLGRHTPDEQRLLAAGDVQAIEDTLGDKAFLFGDKPCGADASVFSFLWAASAPMFKSDIKDDLRQRHKVVAYVRRMQEKYFPEFPFQ